MTPAPPAASAAGNPSGPLFLCSSGAGPSLCCAPPPRPRGGWLWKLGGGGAPPNLRALGVAAVVAYGIFDALTYSVAFCIAFLGYEKATGERERERGWGGSSRGQGRGFTARFPPLPLVCVLPDRPRPPPTALVRLHGSTP